MTLQWEGILVTDRIVKAGRVACRLMFAAKLLF